MTIIRLGAFPKIKKVDNVLYKKILGNKDMSWIERGSYNLGDMGIAWRLHKELFNNENTALIGKAKQHTYRTATWICLLACGAALILLIIFLVCALPHVYFQSERKTY